MAIGREHGSTKLSGTTPGAKLEIPKEFPKGESQDRFSSAILNWGAEATPARRAKGRTMYMDKQVLRSQDVKERLPE